MCVCVCVGGGGIGGHYPAACGRALHSSAGMLGAVVRVWRGEKGIIMPHVRGRAPHSSAGASVLVGGKGAVDVGQGGAEPVGRAWHSNSGVYQSVRWKRRGEGEGAGRMKDAPMKILDLA